MQITSYIRNYGDNYYATVQLPSGWEYTVTDSLSALDGSRKVNCMHCSGECPHARTVREGGEHGKVRVGFWRGVVDLSNAVLCAEHSNDRI